MNLKDPRPPTDFLDRARSLVRALHSNNIEALPDGTTAAQLEELIQQSLEAANEVGIANDTLKRKQEDRDSIYSIIWKVTKGGGAFIESRFGNDAIQIEQVGRKRRSRYARPARKPVPQTVTVGMIERGPITSQILLNQDQPETNAIAHTNGTHA